MKQQEGQELNAFDQLELGPLRTLLYGAISGACAEAATYPFEVIRRQLQMQVQATKMNAFATTIKIIEQGGIPALYAGLIPSLLQNGLTKYIDGLSMKTGGIHKEVVFHEDFYTRGLLENISLSNIHPLGQEDNFINHWAAMTRTVLWRHYYGAKATINVYGLSQVGDNQYSEAKIWVANDAQDTFNSISAGWHVHPRLYGDHDTHFFIQWSVREREISCYNLLCKGFVPFKSSKYIPGATLHPLSMIDGQQYEITLKIFKDSISGDWWLHTGSNADEPVGYWPKSIFTSLAESANLVQWGGVVGFYKGQKSPPMGNGRYPHEGKAAYFRDVQTVLRSGDLDIPPTKRFEDKTDCYQFDGDKDLFYFGGPGGCLD